jgi:contact-dependent growth inhibition (CDI) system CdiI-like immunity protein
MGQITDRFPSACILFYDYFHQDYEGPPEAVVLKFVKEQPTELSERAAQEIEMILKEFHDEKSLEAVLEAFANRFDVLRFKSSYRAWLDEVVNIIRAGIHPRAKH